MKKVNINNVAKIAVLDALNTKINENFNTDDSLNFLLKEMKEVK